MQLLEFSVSNTLYAVIATGAAVSALAFGIGRSILLARVTAAEARRAQAEESAGLWRRKAELAEHDARDAAAEGQKQLRERTDVIARLEDQLARSRRDAIVNEEAARKRIGELEDIVREKGDALVQQEREFRNRVAHMTGEMKAVVAKLTRDVA